MAPENPVQVPFPRPSLASTDTNIRIPVADFATLNPRLYGCLSPIMLAPIVQYCTRTSKHAVGELGQVFRCIAA